MTCCFFSSFKTLLTIREDSALPSNQCPGCWFDGLQLAGFQVTITGRFWVSTEVAYLAGKSWRFSDVSRHWWPGLEGTLTLDVFSDKVAALAGSVVAGVLATSSHFGW